MPETALESLPRKLNLGCGPKRMEGCLNVDVSPRAASDLTVDLEKFPWPFPDDHFDEIYAFDVIEHLSDTVATMREILRVAAPGAKIHFTVPHFSSPNAFADPTHRHQFAASTFDFFAKGATFDFSPKGHFRSVATTIYFHPSLLNRVVWRLVRRFREAYEKRWAWLFPAWFMEVRLEAVK